MVTSLRAELPHVAVTTTEASSTDQLRLVREGTLDLGLVHERLPMLRGARLFGQPFGVAVRQGIRWRAGRRAGRATSTTCGRWRMPGSRCRSHATG
jgi:hypothetical protein